MKKIKRISPKSLAKISGLIYGFLGLLAGAVVLLISIFSGEKGVLLALLAFIVVPILYGAIGFLMGYLIAFIYNFAAKKMGGIEVEVE
jgi:hypothetical protein